VCKVVAGCCGMVQPLEEWAEREQALVECTHNVWIGEGGFGCDLAVSVSASTMEVVCW
jgi:hypothetical protein